MSLCGWQIFKRKKTINKIGGIFWMIFGTGGTIMMIISLRLGIPVIFKLNLVVNGSRQGL